MKNRKKNLPAPGEALSFERLHLFQRAFWRAVKSPLLNYNLYQLKEHIRAQLAQARDTGQAIPPAYSKSPGGGVYPRPVR